MEESLDREKLKHCVREVEALQKAPELVAHQRMSQCSKVVSHGSEYNLQRLREATAKNQWSVSCWPRIARRLGSRQDWNTPCGNGTIARADEKKDEVRIVEEVHKQKISRNDRKCRWKRRTLARHGEEECKF